ncbi:hypothetical protein OH77DRAFT_441718 [Trametes cingulata]|nr:hypothetical protein OH77DRAFT_441718 [Trametes cingulata]
MAAQQTSAAEVSSIGESSQISASAPGPSTASQASSVAPAETSIQRDPAPPSPSSESSSAAPAASDPVSSPSRSSATSLAPTQPLASSSAAPASASHSAVAVSSEPAATPASSASKGIGNSPGSTSVRAVSSPSSPAPASHDHTQSVPEIPLPITKLAPVIHSTAAASPAPRISASSAAGTEAAAVPSSESGPVLTPLVQQNDVSVHASQAAAPTSAAHGPVSSPEVHAPPSAAPHVSASPVSASAMNDSENGSGMMQANAQTQSPTATSTITDQPETTLSTPVFVTVTNSDHRTSLSVPPIFTSIVVSELPDGGLVSYTHVIANPTGIYGVEVDNPMGFFANSGAVAGVFLAVGIVVTAIGVGICLFIRRRRRPRFIDTISRPLPMPENPFEDPRDFTPPNMRYALGHPEGSTLVIGPMSRPSGDTRRSSSGRSSSTRSTDRYHGLGLAGVGAHGRSASMGSARLSSEMRQHHLSGQSGVVGLAITTDQRVESARSRRPEPSSARSSPSFYPPTLPELRNEHNEGALVEVPLERPSNLNRTGSSPSVHSVTRKPVPSPEPEPEPVKEAIVAPIPRAPEQITTTRPPVVPPRSPLRRNSYHNSTTSPMTVPQPLSPTPSYTRAQISPETPPQRHTPTLTLPPPVPPRAPRDRDTFGSEMAAVVLKTFEPLTPPTSLSSLSPPTSSQGHESESSAPPPLSPGSERGNPFQDGREERVARAGPPGLAGYGLPMSPRKDTFYSRRSTSQRRPSIEWKN